MYFTQTVAKATILADRLDTIGLKRDFFFYGDRYFQIIHFEPTFKKLINVYIIIYVQFYVYPTGG